MSFGLVSANKAYAANSITNFALSNALKIDSAYWSKNSSTVGTFTLSDMSPDVQYCAVVVKQVDLSGKTQDFGIFYTSVDTSEADDTTFKCSVAINLNVSYTHLNGKYTMYPTVADDGKNILPVISTGSITNYYIDTIAPKTKISSVKLVEGKKLELTSTIDNQGSAVSAQIEYWYRLNDGTWTKISTGSTTASFTMSDYGKYEFCTIGFDKLGNVETKTKIAEGSYTLVEPEPTPEPVITPKPTPAPVIAPVTNNNDSEAVLTAEEEVETIEEETPEIVEEETGEEQELEIVETKEEEPVKMSLLGWIIGILMLLLTAGIVIFFLIKRKRDKEEKK